MKVSDVRQYEASLGRKRSILMEQWIPLLQTLVWPLFIAGLLIWFRENVSAILKEIVIRIHNSPNLEIGPGGVKISGAQLPIPLAAAMEVDTRPIENLPHQIYITHQATRDPSLDREHLQYYRLRIAIDAESAELLDDIEKVVFHLHPTFKNPNRTTTDRQNGFMILTAGWGEFNMTAEVYFRSEKPKLVIERFINFVPVTT